jgi:hypothetical protein
MADSVDFEGARRNYLDLPEEGLLGEGKPMRDLKEALAKFATQTWCEPLVGFMERARYPQLPKPDILSVFRGV